MSFLRPDTALTDDIYGRVDISYLESQTRAAGKTTETSTLNQVYTLGFDKDLTSTLALGGDLRLTITEKDDRKEDSFFPMFYLNFTPPPMFNLSFSYNRTETAPTGADNISNTFMNVTFALPMEDYPSLTASYNRYTTQDYLDPHKVDTTTSNLLLNSLYSFRFLDTDSDLNYTFSRVKTEDKVNGTVTETPSHFVTTTLSRSFWDRKVSTDLNMGYNWIKYESTSLGGETRFEQEISPTEGLYAQDASPATDPLASTPALIDNDTVTSAGIDLNGSFRNIGVRFTITQSLHKIHLYISTSDTNIATYNFGWQLYTSSDGISWTFQGSPSVSFEAAFSRFVLSFSETSALYFKIVNTTFPSGALPVNVTEIKPVGFILSTPTETLTYITQRDFGGFRVSFVPIERLTLAYNINYDHYTQELNDLSSLTVTQGSNMNIVVLPEYLTFLTSYTNSRVSSSQTVTTGIFRTDTGFDNYTLTLSSTPLPTVNANINYSLTETLIDGEDATKTDTLSTDVFMNLYRGVDLNIGGNLTKTKNIQADARTNTVYYYLHTNLVPWETVNILIDASINRTTTESLTATTTSTIEVLTTSISYTPTRKLFFSATLNVEPSHQQSYNITWLPSRSIQATVRYGFSVDSRNMGANLNWTPIRRLTMNFGYTFTEDDSMDTGSDSFFARVSLQI